MEQGGCHDASTLVLGAPGCERDRVASICALFGPVDCCKSIRDGLQRLQEPRDLTAAIIWHPLPDGSGLQVAAQIRRRRSAPLLIVGTADDHDAIHRSFQLGAAYLCPPVTKREIESFARRAADRASLHALGQERAAAVLASRCGLSPREREIVEHAVAGVPRREIAERMGIQDSTLKWHIRSLLRKCDATNLNEVVRAALKNSFTPRSHQA